MAIRPHLDLAVDLAPEIVARRLAEALARHPGRGGVRGLHAQINVPAAERHLWSPWLDFEITPRADGALLTGRFGPNPGVWTMYLAVYAALGLIGLGLGFFGLAQQLAKEPPTAWWGFIPIVVIAASAYALPFVGQRLTVEQMEQLTKFVQDAVDSPAEPSSSSIVDPEQR